ncbi:EFR1 family ferrodoxin [Lachnospiraceae bacterium NSJ-143]|nr:EFR1 family ferrodoxin [Lachnospiraceae bacterium NSJ-143]
MVKKVCAMYFSATGTTEKIVTRIGADIASALSAELDLFSFTRPEERAEPKIIPEDEVLVIGTPVYAGRVPNVLLKYLDTVTSSGAMAIPVVLYGNRNYDDALIELRDILEKNGFRTIAAGAFVGAHAFSYTLAKGRPDEADIELAHELAVKAVEKIKSPELPSTPVAVKGRSPIGPYYTPRGLDGNPVSILKVRPLTNDKCDSCGLCAALCPMGSINPENPKEYIGKGICIKCGACVKKCPKGAKYYTDEGYLSHKAALERDYSRRGQVDLFY